MQLVVMMAVMVLSVSGSYNFEQPLPIQLTLKMARLSTLTVLPIRVCSRVHFTKSRRIPSMVPSENGVLCSAM